ncbi:MAG: Lysyl-tRNA synthetase (class II) [Ktedonobacterales bacterium]|jgi:lysyl-tRNA synthetase class 2|nr:MAG: Lysyl-tRNA synthetase (class II) [Ktedonobacterales bacterium]
MSDEREARLEKLAALREAGIEPYPTRSHRDTMAADALARYDELQGQTITIAGRLMQLREMGKAAFAHLEDGSGRIQIYIKRDAVGDEAFRRIRLLDLGDILEATGTLFTTRTGEKTLHVDTYTILAKSLATLPSKGAGGDLKLFDPEVRQRKRYLDLIANRETGVPIFLARAKILASMRDFLNARGFVEVETPILQPLYGGATARPFITHHNTLDRDLYLRIAPELYLKRLLVGGIERVYEIARNFRNEGVDRSHNPEFTMMECYQAYADYEDVMRLVEDMYAYIAQQVLGTTKFDYLGVPVDLTPPWKRIPLREAILEFTGIDYDQYPDRDTLAVAMGKAGYTVDPKLARGRLIDELKDTVIKGETAKLKDPVFLYDYPRDLSPLAKQKPGTSDTAERFQAFAGGLELGNAFTELNDPLDQRARFEDQARQRAGGDDEAQMLDEDYIEALEVGLPPAGGFGGGIDRLAMLLTNQDSIREVILFPTMREVK